MNHEDIWNAARSGKLFTIKNVRITGMETYEHPIGTSHLIKFKSRNSKTGNESVLQDVNLDDISICESPKHDPFRPFKAGDVARVVERFGRKDVRETLGELVTVTEDEAGTTFIRVKNENGEDTLISWMYLELITPVEELEPYSIDPANTNVLFKRGKKFATFEDDDEAQELCDRLNAKWRKEQANA